MRSRPLRHNGLLKAERPKIRQRISPVRHRMDEWSSNVYFGL